MLVIDLVPVCRILLSQVHVSLHTVHVSPHTQVLARCPKLNNLKDWMWCHTSALMKSGTMFRRKSWVVLARCDGALSCMNTKSLAEPYANLHELEKAIQLEWNEIDAHSASHSSRPTHVGSYSVSGVITTVTIHHCHCFPLQTQNLPFQKSFPVPIKDCLQDSRLLNSFSFSFYIILLVWYSGTCSRLNWLPVSFWLHVKYFKYFILVS